MTHLGQITMSPEGFKRLQKRLEELNDPNFKFTPTETPVLRMYAKRAQEEQDKDDADIQTCRSIES